MHDTDAAEVWRQMQRDGKEDMMAAQRAVAAQLGGVAWSSVRVSEEGYEDDQDNGNDDCDGNLDDEAAYEKARARILGIERGMAFDARCRARASPLELRANRVLIRMRADDDEMVFARATNDSRSSSCQPDNLPGPSHSGSLCGQQQTASLHASDRRRRRFAGDRFLANLDLVPQTKLFAAAQRMPKGAHLHLHHTACLEPRVLLALARDAEHMFVTSDVSLAPELDHRHHYQQKHHGDEAAPMSSSSSTTGGSGSALDRCELQFCVLERAAERPGDIFAPDYADRRTMRFRDFLDGFPRRYPRLDVDAWLESKLVLNAEQVYSPLQTAEGAWKHFGARTRMVKGLLGHESAFRAYARLLLEHLVRDGVAYAELRPNFMPGNRLRRDDGSGPLDNAAAVEILIDVAARFRDQRAAEGGFFGGVKIIYCTPRSFSPEAVGEALDECLDFKKRWPDWIAGFDLVGEEAKGRPLRDFAGVLLAFKRRCAAEGVEVPLLLHCGETQGDEADDNVADALLLGARRIGHGFALARRPHLMQRLRAGGVCVELCPVSNELLGLTPRVAGHAMYALLANNVHCTVNSDNGGIFQSSLSHDFYQVMVGKADMDLFGWKQLAFWSIEHACLDGSEREALLRHWLAQWDEYICWLVDTYGEDETGRG